MSISMRTPSVESNIRTGSSTTLTDGEPYHHSDPLEQADTFDTPRTSTPVDHSPVPVSSATVDIMDADDDYWGEFDSPDEPDPRSLATPATPLATQLVVLFRPGLYPPLPHLSLRLPLRQQIIRIDHITVRSSMP